jgi:Short C-terminal domain
MAVEDIERLHALKQKGLLSEEEFEQQKAEILAQGAQPQTSSYGLLTDASFWLAAITHLYLLRWLVGYLITSAFYFNPVMLIPFSSIRLAILGYAPSIFEYASDILVIAGLAVIVGIWKFLAKRRSRINGGVAILIKVLTPILIAVAFEAIGGFVLTRFI